MKKLAKVLFVSALFLGLTACGSQEDSELAAVSASAPNLTASAPQFRCGNGVVVIRVVNNGNSNAAASFFRVDQSNAPSQAFAVPALKKGESRGIGIVVKYKDGNLDAKIKIDSNKNVAESNEQDNELRLVCRG